MAADVQDHPGVLVIHGPNLNMLGTREPDVYGTTTLADIDNGLARQGRSCGVQVDVFQSNHEGAIVDRLQAAVGRYQGLIINPAAFTHTSVAIRDAIVLLDVPVIEVHLSNVDKREPFRHRSMIADIATARISGFGARGYRLALAGLAEMLGATPEPEY